VCPGRHITAGFGLVRRGVHPDLDEMVDYGDWDGEFVLGRGILTPVRFDESLDAEPVLEKPVTKIIFQAKIDVIRNRSDTQPLPIKALMIDILLPHQCVDPTFHFLPTEDGSTARVLTTASDIPNNDVEMKKYIKEMRDVENRNNGKTYSVVFFVKIESTMTTGMMKRDNGFYKWLTTKNIFIRPFPFTKTFDVVNTGFISHMSGTLHNRDKINARDDTRFIICLTDKNLGPAIIERDVYIRMALTEHLRNGNAYRRLSQEEASRLVTTTENELKQLITEHAHCLSKAEHTYFERSYNQQHRIPKFYLTMKVHKTPMTSRPVVSCVGSFNEIFSKWLDYQVEATPYQ
jgi:hypothetical protein